MFCRLILQCAIRYDLYCRYEALVPGDNELVAKYKEKLYAFVSESKREKFMRLVLHPFLVSNLSIFIICYV